MKILAIHSVGWEGATNPPVHIWRVWRPLRELAKHVDWQIDYQPHLVATRVGNEGKQTFTDAEINAAGEKLAGYDLVFLSYSVLDGVAYTFLEAVSRRYGTKFVIDFDDDVFSVAGDNPIWRTVARQRIRELQIIAQDAPHIIASTSRLAHSLRNARLERPMGSVEVIPNFISDDYRPRMKAPDPDRIVIGYFGGTSHWADIHHTGLRKALAKIVKNYPQVYVRSAGMPIDIPIAEKRISFMDSVGGLDWPAAASADLDMDLVVAPLLATHFNDGKSNIKWQEATRIGIPMIASNVGPYADLPDDVAFKVALDTRSSWYNAIERMLDPELRAWFLDKAQRELEANWRLEDHWQAYRDVFERLMERDSK